MILSINVVDYVKGAWGRRGRSGCDTRSGSSRDICRGGHRFTCEAPAGRTVASVQRNYRLKVPLHPLFVVREYACGRHQLLQGSPTYPGLQYVPPLPRLGFEDTNQFFEAAAPLPFGKSNRAERGLRGRLRHAWTSRETEDGLRVGARGLRESVGSSEGKYLKF